jgi:hypothetical protein
VTVFADIGRQNMGRVLPCCSGTIVTGGAASADIGVAEIGGGPRAGGMAIATLRVRLDMTNRLAFCGRAIVTAIAGAEDRIVIDCTDRRPRVGRMAVLASRSGGYMRRAFPGCRRPVVAA